MAKIRKVNKWEFGSSSSENHNSSEVELANILVGNSVLKIEPG